MAPETILIIDDHALFRSGLVAMLSAAFGDVSLLDSGLRDEALADVAVLPTVVLLDIQLSGTSGLDGLGLIRRRWPAARVVVVSAHVLPMTVDAALAGGAVAFLSKADRPERMMTVLRELLARPFAPSSARGAPSPALTVRQAEVLAIVEQGLSNKVIGRRLGLARERLTQQRLGRLVVAGEAQKGGEVGAGGGMARRELQRVPRGVHRVLDRALPIASEAELHPGVDPAGPELDGGAEGPLGFRRLAQRHGGLAADVVRLGLPGRLAAGRAGRRARRRPRADPPLAERQPGPVHHRCSPRSPLPPNPTRSTTANRPTCI